MSEFLIFYAVLGGVIGTLWLTGHIDQLIQRRRKVAEINGRRPDGLIAKLVCGALVIGFFVFFVTQGGNSGSVEGCFGSMRC